MMMPSFGAFAAQEDVQITYDSITEYVEVSGGAETKDADSQISLAKFINMISNFFNNQKTTASVPNLHDYRRHGKGKERKEA